MSDVWFKALLIAWLVLSGAAGWGQAPTAGPVLPAGSEQARSAEMHEIRAELARLSARLDALERGGAASALREERGSTAAVADPSVASASPQVEALPGEPAGATSGLSASASPKATSRTAVAAQPAVAIAPATAQVEPSRAGSILPAHLPGGATLNYTFDGYYEYNFNQPAGRVNDLRAYDVLSNSFSINQAGLIYELAPDRDQHRRFGLRLDLQFGQATETLQGNPGVETRPDIYRNVFQAYGTYVAPVGKGLTLDFGKWASSLGIEGNYTKDQMNYTRSFLFYYLPFYHEGVRAGYQVNDRLKLNYWVVNGANQTEEVNGFKDQLFGFVLSPSKRVTWTSNYYFGQEHANASPATSCVAPVQPGLCVAAIRPAPDGKLHILNNYATWQVTPKLTLQGEGDYLIQRQWAHEAPGQSTTPAHVSAGAVYAQYQVLPRWSLTTRSEYLSDRDGLFSNRSQAIKGVTATSKYTVGEGLDLFFEFRRDWTNQDYFRTHDPNVLADHQTTATVGLVWWYGGKQGSW